MLDALDASRPRPHDDPRCRGAHVLRRIGSSRRSERRDNNARISITDNAAQHHTTGQSPCCDRARAYGSQTRAYGSQTRAYDSQTSAYGSQTKRNQERERKTDHRNDLAG